MLSLEIMVSNFNSLIAAEEYAVMLDLLICFVRRR